MVTLEYAETLLQAVPQEIIVVSDEIFQLLSVTLGHSAPDTVVFSGSHYAELFRCAGYTVWTGVEAEPSTETVKKMVEFLKERL